MDVSAKLKPEGSIMAGIATVAAVYGIYNLNLGSTAGVHATDANHPAHETSRKKAGYVSLAFVGTMVLFTRDFRVGTLGFGTIIAMEVNYRHAIMVHPASGQLVPPENSAFQPVEDNQIADQPEDSYATSY